MLGSKLVDLGSSQFHLILDFSDLWSFSSLDSNNQRWKVSLDIQVTLVFNSCQFIGTIGILACWKAFDAVQICQSNKFSTMGGCHSSVVLSVPIILRPLVLIPSTPSTLFFNLYYWNCNQKKNENKQKEATTGLFKKNKFSTIILAKKSEQIDIDLIQTEDFWV